MPARLSFQMRTMSAEAEPRMRDEDFGPDEEADAESYLEDNGGELMERLKELEVSHAPPPPLFFSHPALLFQHLAGLCRSCN